jgi:hypothetical protein
MFAQVKELLSNYGKIDLLWFDGGWERKPEQWQAKQLHEMIRSFLLSMRRTKKILSENLWRRCGLKVCELGCIFP